MWVFGFFFVTVYSVKKQPDQQQGQKEQVPEQEPPETGPGLQAPKHSGPNDTVHQ